MRPSPFSRAPRAESREPPLHGSGIGGAGTLLDEELDDELLLEDELLDDEELDEPVDDELLLDERLLDDDSLDDELDELPPPSPMIESTPSGAANTRPASTIAESGFSLKSWYGVAVVPAARRDASADGTYPAVTIPRSATSSVRLNPSSRASSPRRRNVPTPARRHARTACRRG